MKLFKQYLIETNAFQSLVEIFSLVCANIVSYKLCSVRCKIEINHGKLSLSLQLRNCDPKPSDPMQFIRKRLAEPAFDADEFQSMKQSLIKLTDDMSQIQGTVSKIANIVSKLLPPPNVSTQSMENNAGDESHISMLDETMDFDETLNQTVINSADLHSAMQTSTNSSDASNASKSDENLAGFTVEIVEVDVVQQSSLPVSQESITTYTSTPNTSLNATQTSGSGQNGSSTDESTGNTTPTSSESESQTKVDIENLPIVMKNENSAEQLYVISYLLYFVSISTQNK